MSPTLRSTLRLLLPAVALSYLPFLVLHALCLTGIGGWQLPGSELLLLAPMLVAPVALVGSLLCLTVARWRQRATALSLPSAALLILLVPTIRCAWMLRRAGFALAAERAAPLVAAVERHYAETGAPPVQLDALVPRFLDALPSGLPPLRIQTGPDVQRRYRGNAWVLVADVPTGVLNWDEFVYFPNGDYPVRGHGGWFERIGGWAYLHE